MRLFRRKQTELPCRDIVEVVTAYLENDLEDGLRRRFEDHLSGCDECAAYVEQMRRTIAITGESIAPQQLAPDLREGLQRAFAGWQRDHPKP
jgi:anti-sigma factor RsiW